MGNYTQKDVEYMKIASKLCDNAECGYKVGCLVVADNKILFEAWNKRLPGNIFCNDRTCIREEENLKGGKDIHKVCAIHAEQSVIAQAAREGVSLKGAHIYVTTYPCVICARSIVESGVSRLYFMSEYMGEDFASPLFKKANLEVIQIPLEVCWPD